MSESLVERIKRLQGARDRTALPGAPTACTGPGPQAEILPTTIPTRNRKGEASEARAVRAPPTGPTAPQITQTSRQATSAQYGR